MFRKQNSFFLIILVVAFSFEACQNSKKADKPKLTDENSVVIQGRFDEVRVPKDPQRIVAYSYQGLDILEAMGLADRVVGYSKANTPKYLKKFQDDQSIQDFGGTKDPNFEKINAAEPDLIIMEHRIEKDYDELSKIAPAIFIDNDYEDYIGSIKENVTKVGEIFEMEDKAKEVITDLEKTIEANKAKVNSENALIVMYNRGNFGAFGSNSRYGFIHDDFNVAIAAKDIQSSIHGYNISSEYIQEKNPDILFVIDKNAAHGEGDIHKKEIENKLIKQTKAYKNNKIIYLTPDLWYYGGGVQAMKKMADEVGESFKE